LSQGRRGDRLADLHLVNQNGVHEFELSDKGRARLLQVLVDDRVLLFEGSNQLVELLAVLDDETLLGWVIEHVA